MRLNQIASCSSLRLARLPADTKPVHSQALVRAVAIGRVLGGLAAAKIGGPALFGGEGRRRHPDRLVRAVAERLVLRAAAGAPVIALARFEFRWVGRFLRD